MLFRHLAFAVVALLPQLLGPAAQAQLSPDYPAYFKKAREIYQKSDEKERKKLAKSINESSLIEIIQKDPKKVDESREELLAEVQKESQASKSDPTKHLRLIPPNGQPGYSELKFYVSHDIAGHKKDNLVKVWADFLSQASKQIVLNVFDFDLDEVAQVLIQKAGKGLDVRVGIDQNEIAAKPEIKAIADALRRGGVHVTEVQSVALNHQKTAAIDWEDQNKARALFSSGNLTQSCLGPEGDLKAIPEAVRPKNSVPNANHVLTLKSWLLANLVQHELTKTLDFNLHGAEYPTTGSYQVTGPGVDPYTLDPYPEHSVIITFSPGGSNRSINKNLIAHFIRKSVGPIRMAQFAYSSQAVSTALLERAVHDYQVSGNFDFKSVGDTPFALQKWSQFLKMSGLAQQVGTDKKKKFVEDRNSPWVKELTALQLQSLRDQVKIGPPEYRNSKVTVNGTSYDLSAKVHHKVLVAPPFAILGTSFNFSDGAESNNEQILVFRDQDMVKNGTAIVESLYNRSQNSVYGEAQRRNSSGENTDDQNPDETDDGGR